ncbi:MAG: hypothetical protein Q8888_00665 [Vigna little leaf phytoplasma]|nr:hypothetical protein [Vigna little leaf phytoplasma]
MIIILGTEFFDLSQLHQLRGQMDCNTFQNYYFFGFAYNHESLDILTKK